MGSLIRKSIVAAAFVSMAALCFTPQAKAGQAGSVPGPTQEQINATLETFKGMPPEQREQLLKQAIENLQNMSPEDRQRLLEIAKARAQAMSGGQLSAYESQMNGVLTPEQKQRIMEQIRSQIPQAVPASAVPPQNNTGALMQQIRSLPPEQRQKLLDELNRTNTTGAPASK